MAKSNSGKFYGEKKVKSLWNQICDGNKINFIIDFEEFKVLIELYAIY